MLFEQKKEVCGYDLVREGEETILRVNCELCNKSPSIEDDPICMAKTMEKLIEASDATKLVFFQRRDYEYDFAQTQMLKEVAMLFNNLVKQKNIFSYHALNFGGTCTKCLDRRYNDIQLVIFQQLKSDPLGAYVELKRLLRTEKIFLEKQIEQKCIDCTNKYVALLTYLIDQLDKTKLVTVAKPYLAGYKIGNRDVYRTIFVPIIKPDFMFTKLMMNIPANGEEIDNYTVGKDTEVTVFKFPDTVQYLYHIVPPEFKLSEEKYEILDMARKIMAEHKPKKSEFVDPARMRQVFINVGQDLLEELINYRNVTMTSKEIRELTEILIRYTVGFGLIEVLLSDEKIQDISVNSPMGHIPIFVVHADYDDCKTNIIPTKGEAESWASKLRMISGRPLDEANPILDTELELPGASTRVSAVSPPLNPNGIAYSFRRHRDKPWTLPLFMKVKTLNPLAAGLLSFIIDGSRTMLICGARSSGKSSLLSSLLVEIMRRYRIITIEDTLELPVGSLRRLGYNIQPLKVASALARGTSEMTAEDGIRSTLRLGDSALIVGEVRSAEAKSLYEAMRVGAAANVVAGTIHGDSPYGIYDRVVNDIGVPKTSFKATDICIIVNPLKSADGMHKFRRITQITEVGKKWENDPLAENAFFDLMKYDSPSDELKPSDGLITGESEILKTIAGNVKDFAGNWDAVWQNVLLRAKCKEELVKIAVRHNEMDWLEAQFVILCNDKMHIISEDVKEELGVLNHKEIFKRWKLWLDKDISRKIENQ